MLQQAILRHPETFTNPNFRNCYFPATPPRNQLPHAFHPRYCLILATTASPVALGRLGPKNAWPPAAAAGAHRQISPAPWKALPRNLAPPHQAHGTIGQAQLSMLKRVRVHKQCITWPNLTLEKKKGMLGKLGDHSYISWLCRRVYILKFQN